MSFVSKPCRKVARSAPAKAICARGEIGPMVALSRTAASSAVPVMELLGFKVDAALVEAPSLYVRVAAARAARGQRSAAGDGRHWIHDICPRKPDRPRGR